MELQNILCERRVKEGISSVLVQSGLQESWWAETMKCYCHLRDVQNVQADDLQEERHLARQTAVIYRCVHSGRRLHAGNSEAF